jgi:hypothetical protein
MPRPPPPSSPLLLLLLLLLLPEPAAAHSAVRSTTTATWSNTKLWRDTAGVLLRTGDGNVLRAPDGLWYLYGNRYRCYPRNISCMGKVFGTTFAVYSSPDLQTWTLNSSSVFPQMDMGPFNSTAHAYAEPFCLYNRKHKHFVLWFTGGGFAGTSITLWSAVSTSAVGPFVMVGWPHSAGHVPGLFKGTQMDFWVDGDEAWMHHNVAGDPKHAVGQVITKLTDDFLHATDQYTFVPSTFLAGGGLFERLGRWYMMAGTPCCLCSTGASAEVWMAPQPLGPWVHTSSLIAPVAPTTNASRCGFERPPCTWEIRAQQFGVFGLGPLTRVFVGQRWGSAPVKCEDGQYWGVLHFDEATGKPLPLRHRSSETVELPPWPPSLRGGGDDSRRLPQFPGPPPPPPPSSGSSGIADEQGEEGGGSGGGGGAPVVPWRVTPSPMLTRFAASVSPTMPTPYPRPQLLRRWPPQRPPMHHRSEESHGGGAGSSASDGLWRSLNGLWLLEIHHGVHSLPTTLTALPLRGSGSSVQQREILVPFPLEAPLRCTRMPSRPASNVCALLFGTEISPLQRLIRSRS